ncbi:MAG TPA: sterol desaturase family protein [Steroidobacteraceae bacterium]|nr:sterol desaturase family protein [Steroidobacteraceae bacterium]
MNYVEVAVPFFVLAMVVEFVYGRLRKRQTYRLNDTVNSLQLGTLSQLVNVLKLGFSATVLGWLAHLLAIPQWSMDPVWQWALAFVVYDFLYYWKHRLGHEWRIMWASHIAHHQSEEFNLSTALRQTGTDFLGFVFYLPLFFIGVPAPAVITVGSLNLIYQFWVHTEHIRRLGPLEWALVTPSNHRVHHARNPEYLDTNYGGVFILWDRLFGTFKAERPEVPCVYGITTGLNSWNPIWANAHFWLETAHQAWRARRWSDKFKIWFMPPAWAPDTIQDAPPPKEAKPLTEKFDPLISAFMKGYVFVQYWLLLAASLWLQDAEKNLPRAFVLAAFFWICFSFYVQGVVLEARVYSRRIEWSRLALTLVFAVISGGVGGDTVRDPIFVLTAYAALSALALGIDSVVSARSIGHSMSEIQ